MTEHIDALIVSYKLDKYTNNSLCENLVVHLSNAWEQVVGKDIEPPIELIKRMIVEMLSVTPEWFQVMAKEPPEINKIIMERLTTRLVEIGYYEAEMSKKVSYVS